MAGDRTKPCRASAKGLDFVIGRTHELGHGFLLFDGAAEGGSRGGYWTNARKRSSSQQIARLKPAHTIEAFYLDKDELKEAETGSRLAGANYEYSFGPESSIGLTYMKWAAHADMMPGRDGLNVFNVRAYVSPLRETPELSFEAEHASERNGDALHSNAWTLQGAYELAKVAWKPTLTYRYAFFQGDDPDTAANEAFDPLFPGFHDWGTWWQGEIAGEYFLPNSNLVSHLVRVHVSPVEAVSSGLLFFNFSLDKPGSAGPGRDRDGSRVRGRRLRGLESERQLHNQLRRCLRGLGQGGAADQRTDEELHLWNALHRLQLLTSRARNRSHGRISEAIGPTCRQGVGRHRSRRRDRRAADPPGIDRRAADQSRSRRRPAGCQRPCAAAASSTRLIVRGFPGRARRAAPASARRCASVLRTRL